MKEEQKGYVVDGYLFATEAEAKTAMKEKQGILYLNKNNNLKDVKIMIQVYQKLLEQGLFRTPVGMNYLKQLQDAIREKGMADQIAPIPVRKSREAEETKAAFEKSLTALNDVGSHYKKKFRISIIVILLLTAGLLFMVEVAATTNQPNILNYEEKLINKYEQWEEELNTREEQLKRKEE